MNKLASAIGWFVIVVLAFAWLSSGNDGSDTTLPDEPVSFADDGSYDEEEAFAEEDPPDEEIVDTWEPPRGYKLWRGAGTVAWRWVENPTCDYGRCWQVEIVTRDGCPDGLYASLNIVDSSYAVIDYTNDSLDSLGPEQVARLTLTHLDDGEGEYQGELTEINCY